MITVIVEHTSSEESLRKSLEVDDSLPLKSIKQVLVSAFKIHSSVPVTLAIKGSTQVLEEGKMCSDYGISSETTLVLQRGMVSSLPHCHLTYCAHPSHSLPVSKGK